MNLLRVKSPVSQSLSCFFGDARSLLRLLRWKKGFLLLVRRGKEHTGSCLLKHYISDAVSTVSDQTNGTARESSGWAGLGYRPTLEEASVREFRVLDLPALGLPTRPMRGSRGISAGCVRALSSLCFRCQPARI